MAYLLGINSAYHESAAALIQDGTIIGAVEEERLTRRKHAKTARVDNPDELPVNAIQTVLDMAGVGPGQISHVGFSLDPYDRIEANHSSDLVEAGSWGSPEGEQLFFEHLGRIPEHLAALGIVAPMTFLGHHLCHAASAFYSSPFERSIVIAVDGIGERSSTWIGTGEGLTLRCIKEVMYPASLGFLWEKVCKFLGFSEYDACKIMGLASYGNPARFRAALQTLVWCTTDGGFAMDGGRLRFRREDFEPLADHLGIKPRRLDEAIECSHQDLAAALQERTNEILVHVVRCAIQHIGIGNVCLAGGVALNCVTNRTLLELPEVERLYVQPASHDAGTALGAAQLLWSAYEADKPRPALHHAYLGPSFSDIEIETAILNSQLPYRRVADIGIEVASLLAQSRVVGWFQGGMEFGPRALGNRSLLADPRNADMRAILNEKVKHREPFRPFAPAVLASELKNWFHVGKYSEAADYMLLTYAARANARERAPAAVHIDGTSRVQRVNEATNPRFHALLVEFHRLTGVPMVINTSFNDDEPIVCRPTDALSTFRKTQIDHLAMGDFLVSRPF